jgi:hypothetical protein
MKKWDFEKNHKELSSQDSISFFNVSLEFEFRALQLQGKHFITWATPPTLKDYIFIMHISFEDY